MVLGLALFVVVVLLLIPYTLDIQYRRDVGDDNLVVVLWIGPLPVRLRLAWLRWVRGVLKVRGSVDYQLRLLHSSSRLFGHVFTRLVPEIRMFDLSVAFSLGEPALTATSIGAMWSGIGTTMGLLYRYGQWTRRPHIQITPLYGQPAFKIWLHCIFRVRVGHIIVDQLKRCRDRFIKN